jgi:hypothetical protein
LTRVYVKITRPNIPRVTRHSSSAREELLAWGKARSLRDRANEYSDNANNASDSNVQERFTEIARHYRTLAAAEARGADRLAAERRGPLRASPKEHFDRGREIKALRLKLREFGSKQTDIAVRLECHIIEIKLADLSKGNHPNLREVLAGHVKRLEQALRRSARRVNPDGQIGTDPSALDKGES